MKVKDVIRLMNDRDQIMIYEKHECLACALEGECWQDNHNCSDCVYEHKEFSELEKYCGIVEYVPIKMAERTVEEITIKEKIVRKLKRKNITDWFFAVRIKKKSEDK